MWDPEQLYRPRKREELAKEQEQLVRDLQAVGLPVTSVWDLVNHYVTYPEALPVLLHHLPLLYDGRIKGGIARALIHKGFDEAVEPLIRQFKVEPDSTARWAMGNTLYYLAKKKHLPALMELAAYRRYGSARDRVIEALGKFRHEPAIPLLLDILREGGVEVVYALMALAKFPGRADLAPHVLPHLDDERDYIRNRALKALRKWGVEVETPPKRRRPRTQPDPTDG